MLVRLNRDVQLSEPRGGDEQPARSGPRCRRRDEPDLPEQRPGAVGRSLLLADDRGPGNRSPAHALSTGLHAHGVPLAARRIAIGKTPPVSVLFAAFLGFNPIKSLVGSHVLHNLSAHNQAVLTGRSFFPHLISAPFRTGLHTAFTFAVIACFVAAVACALRGGVYHYSDVHLAADPADPVDEPVLTADAAIGRAPVDAAIGRARA